MRIRLQPEIPILPIVAIPRATMNFSKDDAET
jgi:hypothetical protein